MTLSPVMQECLREEIQKHDGCHEIGLCVHLMIVAACILSDEDLSEELHEESRIFIVDEIMLSCILKGAVTPAYMDEDGEMIFEVTEYGRSQLEEKGSSSGAGQQDGEEER